MGGQAGAVTLDIYGVLAAAEKHSHDLKIADIDVAISVLRKAEVRSLYFPTLTLRMDNEYVHPFAEKRQSVISIGDYVSAADSPLYQHSLSARLGYQLYHFGSSGLKYENAEREVGMARLNAEQTRITLSLAVLDQYAEGLKIEKRLAAEKKIMKRRKLCFRHYQKLRDAGRAGRNEVETAALDLSESMGRLDDLKEARQASLIRLGFYTGEVYSARAVAFSDFDEPSGAEALPDVRRLPEIQALDIQIRQKETEYAIVRKEMLPQLMLYGSYRMYGSSDTPAVSFSELESNDARVALTAEWELFSGFRDSAKADRLLKEVERLRRQKEKRIAELEREAAVIYDNFSGYRHRREKTGTHLARIQASADTLARLAEQQTADRISFLQKEIELIDQELALSLKKTDQGCAALKLKYLGH